jgi:hypothetical protein
MKKLVFFFLIVTFAYSQNDALRISEWRNYTSFRNINSITSISDNLWVGTNGGVFRYNQTTKDLLKMTNVEGLNSLEVTAIFADSKSRIWAGGSNGMIDVYNTNDQSWTNINDISLAYSGQSKKINGFLQKNDSIYILSDFGVSVYDASKKEFRDTYIKFGSFAAFSKVIDLVFTSDKIIALTSSGLAIADKNSKTLISPTEWTCYEKENYFESQDLVDISVFNNSLYVLTQYALYKQNGNSFSKIITFNQSSKKIFTDGSSFYVALEFKILKLNSLGGFDENSTVISNSISTAYLLNNKICLGFATEGLATITNNTLEYFNLNCPNSNLFNGLLISSTGALWAVSVGLNDAVGYGFYKFQDSTWTNYDKTRYPSLRTNAYCALAEADDNSIFVGSWGSGVARVKKDTNITIYDENNSLLVGIQIPDPGSPQFIPIGGIDKDLSGTMWFTNHRAMNGGALLSLSTSSKWTSYQNGVNTNSVYYRRLLVDSDLGTKWIISDVDPVYNGLFYFNEKYALPGTISGWGFLSNDEIYSGSSTSQVQCLALDKNNELWVGTASGLSIIGSIRDPRASITKPCVTTRCNISGQVINCIAVDPLNNKWVGTKTTGVWVLTPDGSSVIEQLNSGNSKLLSDDIRAISINPKDGTVFIGTENGLSSFKTFLVEPLPEFSENLKIYPNPFNPEKASLSIDGLIESSSIKIISPYGKMIKDFASPGGRIAYWDGKDANNEYVSSGIYFVIAYSSDGKQNSLGKVAVVRSGK